MGEKRGMKALELWCKRVCDNYPGVKVENMTTSWRDGLAFCALIHHFRPDLIDFSGLKASDVYANNELAFRTAERHLGIPALLDAEDMVEYEVPDRLSILTYLSQFYQTFASHPSSPVKRSPDSPDCSLTLSTSVSSPPPKEGRRREPCAECGLPVFLAQRLLVGGRLYHRTCFRCARCSAQLTTADCYETQDGAFCCETCPDEEMRPEHAGDKGGSGLAHVRSRTPSPATSAVDKTDPPVAVSSTSLVGLRRMMFENIDRDKDDPLVRSLSDLKKCDKSDSFDEQHRRSSVCDKPLELDTRSSTRLSLSGVDRIDPATMSDPGDVKSDLNVDKSDDEITGGNLDSSVHSSGDISKLASHYALKGRLDHSESSDVCGEDEFSSLTADDSTSIVDAENANVNAHIELDLDSNLDTNLYSNNISNDDAQNREIAISDDDSCNKMVEFKKYIEENLVDAKNDVLIKESEKSEEKHMSATTSENVSLKDALGEEDEFTSLTRDIEQLAIDAKNDEVIKSVIGADAQNEARADAVTRQPNVPKPTERTIKHKPPTPTSRKIQKAIVEPRGVVKKLSDDYPEELNPFGDDDEEESKNEVESKKSSLNPFGSSDEEDNVERIAQAPTPTTRKILPAPQSLNPFWSGDEDEEEESLPPVPKPRKLRTPQPSPEPSPRTRRSLRSATGSLGSASSLASRKKKPAPLPPSPASPYQHLTLPGSRKSYSAPKPPVIPQNRTPSPPPLPLSSPPTSHPSSPTMEGRMFERQRQNSIVSETSSVGTVGSYTLHKSTYGQWKRKKGPAPARPVPVRRAVRPMPFAGIKQELADIEVKVAGLERQGVKLEQTIRDTFERDGASLTPYAEEMVLQLFEIVNEKNELFRRQAELQYLRKQHNLEEEHAELEYQIRVLMLCPERNKTDSDKAREEQLIQRLVDVVERRNEIVDCLEMDRLREQEEDQSVSTQLGIFSAAVGNEVDLRAKIEDKKEKKIKKEKRWSKKEVDKDVDESMEKKKSKKKWFTLHHSTHKS